MASAYQGPCRHNTDFVASHCRQGHGSFSRGVAQRDLRLSTKSDHHLFTGVGDYLPSPCARLGKVQMLCFVRCLDLRTCAGPSYTVSETLQG